MPGGNLKQLGLCMASIPAAVYVGCQKTGSEFLRSYFAFHPELAWSRNGIYFQREDFTPDGYRALFTEANGDAVLIDMYEAIAMGYVFTGLDSWSPSHAVTPDQPLDGRFMVPAPELVVQRVRQALPEARILITIRNQIDWVRSNYLHHIGLLPHGRRTLLDFLSTREGKLVLFAGLYDRTINLYCNAFGRSRVYVLPMERLKLEEDEVLADLCGFLGVTPRAFHTSQRTLNTGKGVSRGNLMRLAASIGVGQRMVELLRPLRQPVEKVLDPLLRRDVLSTTEKRLLASFYAASNHLSSRLVGRNLAALGYPL
jgi:hypothetical protein